MATIPLTAAEQIVAKADSRLRLLDKSETDAQAQLAAIRSELAAIQARVETALHEEQTSRDTVAQLQRAFDREEAAAGLAEGTLAGLDSPSRLERQHLSNAQKQLAAQIEKTRQLQEKSAAQTAKLLQEQGQAQERLAAIAHERQSVRDVRAEAFENWGNSMYQDAALRIDSAQTQIALKQRELDSAKQTLKDLVAEAGGELGQWPALQRRIGNVVPLENEVTRLLEAAITWFDAVQTDGSQRVKLDTMMIRRVMPWVSDLSGLFALQDRDFWLALSGHDAVNVRERKEKIEQLLALYRQHQAQK